MSIHHKTKAELIAMIERDQAAVRRAAGVLRDNAELQNQNADLKSQLKATQNKPPREVVREIVRTVPERVEVPVDRVVRVPTPCPKQAAEIGRLQAKIAELQKTEQVAEYKRWRKMVAVARGGE